MTIMCPPQHGHGGAPLEATDRRQYRSGPRAFQMAKEYGQPTFAANAGRGLISMLLAVGQPLNQLEREAERVLEFVRPFGFFLDRISPPLALVRTLQGKAARFGSLDDGQFRERAYEEPRTAASTCCS